MQTTSGVLRCAVLADWATPGPPRRAEFHHHTVIHANAVDTSRGKKNSLISALRRDSVPANNGKAIRTMSGNGSSTVMLKGIFEQLAEGHQVPKKLAHDFLVGMVDSVTRHLKQGDRIRINGLGTLEVRKREARTGRNPATGEAMQIAASKKVAFRPAKELKEAV
jgi:DNA-binding protein HU-beta